MPLQHRCLCGKTHLLAIEHASQEDGHGHFAAHMLFGQTD